MSVRDEVRKQNARKKSTRKDVQINREDIKKVVSQQKDPPFLTLRVWVNWILSSLQKDRGRIPDNIGNKMLISNNMYITRYYMSSIILVEELSLNTPVTLCQVLTKYLRDNGSDAVIDFTFKNQRMDINLKEGGYPSRINTWKNIMNATIDPEDKWGVTESDKQTAVRCMYTVDKVKAGHQLYRTRMYITLRAKTGSALTKAEKLIFTKLNSMDADYQVLVGDIKEHLEYIAIISDKRSDAIKDIKAIITDEVSLSQFYPNCGSMNKTNGSYLGNNILNYTQFMLDWKTITIARNVYLIAPAGVGKTVWALNACCSAVEDNMAVCVMDIKGNEFNNFINATGGYIVSLRQEATGFINSWKMHKSDTDDAHAEEYFRNRIAFSKQQMMILSGLLDEAERTDFGELLESFHKALYTSRGVLASNRNTWVNTEVLSPFKVFEMFADYMTPEMQRKYSNIARKVLNNLRIHMSREGSLSYLFENEFDYASILEAPTLMFDFGILEGATETTNPTLFKLKFLYMRKLNAEYTAYKYSKGIKIFKVLEESQIVANDPEILKGYVEEFTLRRAQGQTTLLIGNSVQALTNTTMAQALIENVRALLIGELAPEAKETVIKSFDLAEYEDVLDLVGSSPEYSNSFLFINRMEQRPVVPILKIKLQEGKKYKLLSAVPKNTNAIIGGKNEKKSSTDRG